MVPDGGQASSLAAATHTRAREAPPRCRSAAEGAPARPVACGPLLEVPQVRPLWLAARGRRGRVDGQRLAGCRHGSHAGRRYAREESREERLERLRREHGHFMRSLHRGRYSFFTLLVAWGIYLCVIPFLRTPDHVLIALSVFLPFALQFIVISLLD